MTITLDELEWLTYGRQRQHEFFPWMARQTIRMASAPQRHDAHLERLSAGQQSRARCDDRTEEIDMGEFERKGRELWVVLIGLALAVAGAWFILWIINTEHWWTTLLKWVFALSVGPFIVGAAILSIGAMGWALIAPLVRWCKGWRR